MRTTLNVDEDLLQTLRAEAERTRTPFRQVLNRALRMGLERLHPSPARQTYRTPVFNMGDAGAFDMDKALRIAAELEDDETIRKMRLGG